MKASGIVHILIDRRWHSSVLDIQSFCAADRDNEYIQVMANAGERLAVSKQRSHRYHMESFSLKNLSKVEGKK
jgi:hypothetical protein